MSLQKLLGQIWMDRSTRGSNNPISENLIYITLGLTKYNPWKFAVSVFAGYHYIMSL